MPVGRLPRGFLCRAGEGVRHFVQRVLVSEVVAPFRRPARDNRVSVRQRLLGRVALVDCATVRLFLSRDLPVFRLQGVGGRSEEHTSELQSLMRISYAVFCLKKQIKRQSAGTTTTY